MIPMIRTMIIDFFLFDNNSYNIDYLVVYEEFYMSEILVMMYELKIKRKTIINKTLFQKNLPVCELDARRS